MTPSGFETATFLLNFFATVFKDFTSGICTKKTYTDT